MGKKPTVASATKHEALFDSDPDDSEDDEKPESLLHVNQEYANRFEHNKRREELHRLQERYPEIAARAQQNEFAGVADTEESSSEEEDEGHLGDDLEKEWAEALLKIKQRDPSIYNSETLLFKRTSSSSGDEHSSYEDSPPSKREKDYTKKKVLREVLYEQAMEDAEEPFDVDRGTSRKARVHDEKSRIFAYDKEQQEIRDALVGKVREGESDDDDNREHGGFMVTKSIVQKQEANPSKVSDSKSKLNEYFDAQDTLRENDAAFLRQYLQQRLWEQEGDDAGESAAAGTKSAATQDPSSGFVDAMTDEEFLDRADKFESDYNFRSDEPDGTVIQTFPRQIEGLVRREHSKRKRQRDMKRAREEERAQQRDAEVKRLKNLKKQEVGDAISRLAEVSGKGAPDRSLLQNLLDSDFDPSAWDKHMSEAFDSTYYEEAEVEADVTADADGIMKELQAWKDEADGCGFNAVHHKVTGKSADELLPETDYGGGGLKRISGSNSESAQSAGEDDNDEQEDREGRIADSRAQIQELLKEYYTLDHEDEVGGVKTRFKYRKVAPIRDGLSTEDILALQDKDLNSIVGLRKLAAYREDSHQVRPNYKALEQARQKLIDEGLYVDKKAKKVNLMGVKRGGVEKSGPTRIRNTTGRKTSVEKSSVLKPVTKKLATEKKKRPGPALRKALKANAKSEISAPLGESCAVQKDQPKIIGSQVREYVESGPLSSAPALHQMTMDQKVAARHASYGPVVLGKPAVDNRSGMRLGQKDKAKIVDRDQIPCQDCHTAVSRAALKNAKRQMKRREKWEQDRGNKVYA